MLNFDFFKPGLILSISISLLSCKEKSYDQPTQDDLLRSNEIQRKAHLTNDATLLVNEIADSMVSVQNGVIGIASNHQIKERFTAYFKQVKYTSWDDVQPPIIEISTDGSMATVVVQKLIDAQSVDSLNNLGEHGYTLFAWTAQYKSIDGIWKMNANTSTRKELTQEEAFKLPIHLSEEYATINELDLIPEGFAFDNTTQIAYLSSTYKQKIIAIHPDGTYSDFKSEQQDGLWSTLGMEVDEVNNKLWVISSNANEVLPMKYPDPDTEWSSKIFEYDLTTHELIKTYEPDITGRFVFNDLCVSRSGKVFITESVQNKVYALTPTTGTFEALAIQDSLFVFPNGITVADDDRYLYVANRNGIIQYDLQEKAFMYLENPSGIEPIRIDGLAYYKGTLIANQLFNNRILQYDLDEAKGKIATQRILEANNPYFDQPSTGEIAGDAYIYLANAQMSSGFENGNIKALDSLEAVRILKVIIPTK